MPETTDDALSFLIKFIVAMVIVLGIAYLLSPDRQSDVPPVQSVKRAK